MPSARSSLRKKKSSSPRGSASVIRKPDVKSLIYLNTAFDSLNSASALKATQESEILNYLPDILEIGKDLYIESYQAFQKYEFSKSRRQATLVIGLCRLIDGLLKQQFNNELRLPLPPKLPTNSKNLVKVPRLHPKLKVFEAMIRSKLRSSSHFYGQYFAEANTVLGAISNSLYAKPKFH